MSLESAFTSAKSSIAPAMVMIEETVVSIDSHAGPASQMKGFLCRSLLRAGQVLDSVDLLASRYRYQDIWVLCRVLCELTINLSYLQIAPEIEFKRWSNYDLWTDERLITNLAAFGPQFEDALDPRELKLQREQRRMFEQSGLYKDSLAGSWSEKRLEQRAKIVDDMVKLEQNVYQLLCRLTVKVGNSFVHVSPKGIGPQTTPIDFSRRPSLVEIRSTTQAISMSATAVYAGISFTRHRNGLPDHPLANGFGDALRVAFEGTKGPF